MITVNAFSQLAALGTVLVIQTGYMIIAARMLGPEDFGRYSFAWNLIQIFLIAGDFGLHNTVVRLISSNRSDSEVISRVFFWLKAVVSSALFGVVLVIAGLMRESWDVQVSLVIFGVGMALHCLCLALNVVFQAHGKLYFASLNIVIIFAIQAAVGITAMLLGGRVVALSIAYLAGVVVGTVLNGWFFARSVHPIRLGWSVEWKRLVFDSVPVGLATFFQTVSERLAVTFLTLLSGPFQTGIYSAALRVPMSLGNVPTSITSAVLPAMASHQDDPNAVRRLLSRSVLILFASALVLSTGFYFLAGPVISLVYGADYELSNSVLKVLTWWMIPLFMSRILSCVVLSQSRLVKWLPWITGVGLLVNGGAGYLLIYYYESIGAAIGMLVTEVVLVAGYFLAVSGFLFRRSSD